MATMTDSPAIVVRPLVEADRAAAGRVYAAAFPDKFAAMLGAAAGTAAALMAELIAPSPNTWVAERDGQLCGVALTHDNLVDTSEPPFWPMLRRHVGLPQAARAWLNWRLLHQVAIDDPYLYIDSLAVDPACQNGGIGSALLEHVLAEAQRRGKTAVSLYAIDRNTRARVLYERYGFVCLHSERLVRGLGWIAGFRTSNYMELRLDQDEGDGAAAVPQIPTDGRLRRRDRPLGDRVSAAVEHLVWRRERVGP